MKKEALLGGALLALPGVAASTHGGVLSRVESVLETIFLTDLTNPLWQKMLFFFLIFAILFGVTTWLGKSGSNYGKIFERKKIRLVLSFIIAAISVLPLPAETLISISLAYGVVVAFILMGIPILTVVYLYRAFQPGEGERFGYVVRAILMYLLASLLIHIGQATMSFYQPIREITDIAVFACIVLFLINLFLAIFGGPEDNPEGGEGFDIGSLFGGGEDPTRERWRDLRVALRDVQRLTREYREMGLRFITYLQTHHDSTLAPEMQELFDGMRTRERAITTALHTVLNDEHFENLNDADQRTYIATLTRWRQVYGEIIEGILNAMEGRH